MTITDPVTPTVPLDDEAVADVATTSSAVDVAEAERLERNYVELVQRLSRQSVEKNFDPYVDIAWEPRNDGYLRLAEVTPTTR